MGSRLSLHRDPIHACLLCKVGKPSDAIFYAEDSLIRPTTKWPPSSRDSRIVAFAVDRLKVLGHSLGAGTASLFSIMARNDEQVKICSAGGGAGRNTRMGSHYGGPLPPCKQPCARHKQR